MTPDDDDLPSLDFTLPGAFEAAPEPTPVPPPAPPQPEPVRLPPALAEAAELHAAGQDVEACKCLEAAIKSGGLDGDEIRVWTALFDTLQILGQRQAFDNLALAYARRFELSPPTWVAPPAAAHQAQASSGGRAHVALSGKLDASVGEALREGLRLVQTSPLLRIDLAKLNDADEAGCTLLLRALAALKKGRKEFVFGDPEHLAQILATKVSMGVRENPSTWLLLLELYQRAHRQEAFEEAAVNYAVTFEVSPPSWDDSLCAAAPAVAAAEEALAAAAHGPALRGQLLGASVGELAGICAAAAASDEQAIDGSQLIRIDAGSAEQLLAALRPLAADGKRLRIVKLPTLVAAYLETRGVAAVAELGTRIL